MHELSVCQALVTKITELARQHSASRVIEVTLAIGPLSGVEPRLIESAYPLACAGTLADGSRLEIDRKAASRPLPGLRRGERRRAEPSRLRALRRLADGSDRRQRIAALAG